MRDIKVLYAELLEACEKDGVIDNEAFDKHFKGMEPEERKVLLAWVFKTMSAAVGDVFSKAAKFIADGLPSPYEFNKDVYVINLTTFFAGYSKFTGPAIYEDGVKNALSETFVKRNWPITGASFAEMWNAVHEKKVIFHNKPGNELLILGSYENITNAQWEAEGFGELIGMVLNQMGAEDGFPGYVLFHSNLPQHTGKLKAD